MLTRICFHSKWLKLPFAALVCWILLGAQASVAAQARKTVVVLGDSIAAGSGVDPSEAFPSLLQKRIDAEQLPYEVVNAGVSGDTTAGGVRRMPWLLKRQIDVLVLELGGNDGLRGISPDETRANLEKIISLAREKFPHIRIALAGMQMPQNMGADYNQKFRALFESIAKEKKTELIPHLLEGVGAKPELNLPDRIHPNPEGHKVVAENIWSVLGPMLRRQTGTPFGSQNVRPFDLNRVFSFSPTPICLVSAHPTKHLMSQFTAEIIGTMLLVILGDGVVANVLLNKSKGYNGGWIVITAGWGLAVTVAAYSVGWISGGHLNPAVTLGLASIGQFAWDKVPLYIAAQMIGAIIGAIVVYLAYLPHWNVTEDKAAIRGVFCTAPAIRHTVGNLCTEFIGTFVLVLGVLAIPSVKNLSPSSGFATGLGPLLVGTLVFSIGLSLGGATGYAINPARDLGPRIAHAFLPIRGKIHSDWGYAWIPVVAPILGGVAGALFYKSLWAI